MLQPPETDRSDLPDAGKRGLIARISHDKPLPDKYRRRLVADKRKVKRVGSGNTHAVGNRGLPFQAPEQITARSPCPGLNPWGSQLPGGINRIQPCSRN